MVGCAFCILTCLLLGECSRYLIFNISLFFRELKLPGNSLQGELKLQTLQALTSLKYFLFFIFFIFLNANPLKTFLNMTFIFIQ